MDVLKKLVTNTASLKVFLKDQKEGETILNYWTAFIYNAINHEQHFKVG